MTGLHHPVSCSGYMNWTCHGEELWSHEPSNVEGTNMLCRARSGSSSGRRMSSGRGFSVASASGLSFVPPPLAVVYTSSSYSTRLGKKKCWKARLDSVCRQPESGCRQLLPSRTRFLESSHCLLTGQGRLSTGEGHVSTNEGYLSTATGVLHNLGYRSMIPVDKWVLAVDRSPQQQEKEVGRDEEEAATVATKEPTVVVATTRTVATAATTTPIARRVANTAVAGEGKACTMGEGRVVMNSHTPCMYGTFGSVYTSSSYNTKLGSVYTFSSYSSRIFYSRIWMCLHGRKTSCRVSLRM
ncbi:hypothetical protein Taro_054740 [Colocasia esculenta]|uniref:Uncharacterized protein n=1 Tax=Colocasia esculenta TaxID=4460 RepID=A0A843XQX7_COLES|nr:hypothetical protein [Colocasia esculenta]